MPRHKKKKKIIQIPNPLAKSPSPSEFQVMSFDTEPKRKLKQIFMAATR